MKQIRLDKFLTMAGDVSRSQARQYIKKGRVNVDGSPEKKPDRKVDPETNKVELDGEICLYEEFVYLMLYKPAGVISATRDSAERTVLDLVDCKGRDLFPVGRLDKDTEGLVLLTDDGRLAHRLLSPAHHVAKRYYAILDEAVGQEEVKAFAWGLDIGDEKMTMPALLEPVGWISEAEPLTAEGKTISGLPGQEQGFAVYITIQEGRYHQVKRMARAAGRKVLYLKRLSMGPLILDRALEPGTCRTLTREEIEEIRAL